MCEQPGVAGGQISSPEAGTRRRGPPDHAPAQKHGTSGAAKTAVSTQPRARYCRTHGYLHVRGGGSTARPAMMRMGIMMMMII